MTLAAQYLAWEASELTLEGLDCALGTCAWQVTTLDALSSCTITLLEELSSCSITTMHFILHIMARTCPTTVETKPDRYKFMYKCQNICPIRTELLTEVSIVFLAEWELEVGSN